MKDYSGDIKVVYKHYVVHPQVATLPAQAACAAHLQGKFVPMEHLLWEKGFRAGRNFSQENIDKMAQEAGLDMNKLKADMSGKCAEIVRKDQAELAQVGVRGTPAFYINGRYLSGARPIDMFKTVIDEELKKANDRISKGTPVDKYYQTWVLDKGQKKVQ